LGTASMNRNALALMNRPAWEPGIWMGDSGESEPHDYFPEDMEPSDLLEIGWMGLLPPGLRTGFSSKSV